MWSRNCSFFLVNTFNESRVWKEKNNCPQLRLVSDIDSPETTKIVVWVKFVLDLINNQKN